MFQCMFRLITYMSTLLQAGGGGSDRWNRESLMNGVQGGGEGPSCWRSWKGSDTRGGRILHKAEMEEAPDRMNDALEEATVVAGERIYGESARRDPMLGEIKEARRQLLAMRRELRQHTR